MKQISMFLVLFLCVTSYSYAVSLDDYVYEEDDLVSTIGNGSRDFVIVATPEQSYKCENSGKYKPLKEGLLFVGSRPYADKIYLEGEDDVVSSSSYVSVYSKNEDVSDITASIPFNQNYTNDEDIYFITYHSINPSVYSATGKSRQNSSLNFYPIAQEVEISNIGCYYIMAEDQNSDYSIGYYWLYAVKSLIGKDAQVEITTKYLEDTSTLSQGTGKNSDIYSDIRTHVYQVLQQ
ncbi:MAG: hypothetical protein ROM03_04050 [Mucispirillum sp.]|nr:hypothetical protein [Mucispirillum sp.]